MILGRTECFLYSSFYYDFGWVYQHLIYIMMRSNEDIHAGCPLQVFEICMNHFTAEHVEVQIVLGHGTRLVR